MPLPPCEQLENGKIFQDSALERGERATWRVIAMTTVTMVVEILAGWHYGSMALLADGWHMASHAGALGITAFAYAFARRHAENPRYSFGTGKVGSLGGFASAVVLAVVALLMAWESSLRLFNPVPISFNQAIGVAVLGLIVNLVSVKLLHAGHGHHHHHHHGHNHDQCRDPAHDHGGAGHHDHNLRAAYMHVLADALTSITAIVALLAGKYFGLVWLDPLMGLVGSAVIARWSYGLIRETSGVLLDHMQDTDRARAIRDRLEAEPGTHVTDFHLWRVGPHHLSLLCSLTAERPMSPAHYKALLEDIDDLFHVSIEVNTAGSEPVRKK